MTVSYVTRGMGVAIIGVERATRQMPLLYECEYGRI